MYKYKSILGIDKRHAIVVPYNPAWADAATEIVDRVQTVVKKHDVRVHHVGSTAIKIPAKPVIDIAIGSHEFDTDERTAIMKTMHANGIFDPNDFHFDNPTHGRIYDPETVDTDNEVFYANVHVYKETGVNMRQLLDFKRYMLEHPDAANEYVAIKTNALAASNGVLSAYTREKAAFVSNINVLADELYN